MKENTNELEQLQKPVGNLEQLQSRVEKMEKLHLGKIVENDIGMPMLEIVGADTKRVRYILSSYFQKFRLWSTFLDCSRITVIHLRITAADAIDGEGYYCSSPLIEELAEICGYTEHICDIAYSVLGQFEDSETGRKFRFPPSRNKKIERYSENLYAYLRDVHKTIFHNF